MKAAAFADGHEGTVTDEQLLLSCFKQTTVYLLVFIPGCLFCCWFCREGRLRGGGGGAELGLTHHLHSDIRGVVTDTQAKRQGVNTS